MVGVIIFLGSAVYMCGSYLIWPSRYNITAHLNLAFVFLAFFVPAVILENQNDFAPELVTLYTELLIVGAIFYVIGLFTGFQIKAGPTSFSFDVLETKIYERRVIRITKILLISGIIGETLGYLLMGFVPMFAADPLAAKFFRGPYAVPAYVSAIYLSSFFILSTIVPIGLMIWYQNKKKVLFLFLIVTAVGLMMLSLARSPAFSGIVLTVAVIMSFKSKKLFVAFILLIFGLYAFSSVFYFITGIRDYSEMGFALKTDHVFWRVLSSGSNDVNEQLDFLRYFNNNPEWTYGQTIYGGLIPGHYYWNPSVYTLRVITMGQDVNEVISGGVRLPAPMWGYVSFQWPGAAIFSFLSGFARGAIIKYTKYWVNKHKSLLVIIIVMSINIAVFESLPYFFILSMYTIPPILVFLFYMFRFKLK